MLSWCARMVAALCTMHRAAPQVCLARALAVNPEVLILQSPGVHFDYVTQRKVSGGRSPGGHFRKQSRNM